MANRTALFLINGALQGVATDDELLSGGVVVHERALDPSPQADRIILYSKEVLGRSEVFFRASDGTISQVTTAEGNISGWIDSGAFIQLTNPANTVAIGTTSPAGGGTKLHVVGDDGTDSFVFFDESSNSSGDHATFVGRRARGTNASKLAVITGDNLTEFLGQAYDGATFRSVATIQINTETFIAADNLSGYMAFMTRPTGLTAVTTERMRLTGVGELLIGKTTSTSSSHLIQIASSANSRIGMQIETTSTGTTAYAALRMTNTSDSCDVGVTSTGYTPASGIAANEMFIVTNPSLVGINILTQGATYVRFGTNSIERMRLLATGELVVGNVLTSLAITSIIQARSSTGNAHIATSTSSTTSHSGFYSGATSGTFSFYGHNALSAGSTFGVAYANTSRIETNTTGALVIGQILAYDIVFGTNSLGRFTLSSTGYLEMSANYSIVPNADDSGTIGTDNTETGGDPLTIGNRRWHLIRGNIVKSGDYRFENGWTLTEDYTPGLEHGGIKLLRPDGSVAESWE